MKVQITIELDDTPNTHTGKGPSVSPFLSWFEKNHHYWQSANIVVDGDTVLDWQEDALTPKQLDAMRRDVVIAAILAERAANGEELSDADQLSMAMVPRNRGRLGPPYQAVVDDYEANPTSEWAKKKRKSVLAQLKRRDKQVQQFTENKVRHQEVENAKQKLVVDTINYELTRQEAIVAQGGATVHVHRIRAMVVARVMGYGDVDPTPQDDLEQKTWERICRSIEAEATFDLPRRFMQVSEQPMTGQRRHVSFDF